MDREVLRVAAVMEASTVTGPAKNLIEFSELAARDDGSGLPRLEMLVVTFVRGMNGERSSEVHNAFLDALRTASIPARIVNENFRFDPRAIGGLRNAITEYSPDLVQTHNVKSHFILRLAGLDNLYPWIGFHHGYTSTDFKMELYNRLDRWSLPRARRVVTVCRPFADQMVARGVRREKITILHNSVRASHRGGGREAAEFRESLQIPEDEPVLLTVGRFSKEKGHADLVEAVAELRRIYERPFKVVLVGDGPERVLVQERIRALGMENAFRFAGQVSNVESFYRIASVVVLPSHSEGSPNVLLEAMARALPVAATAVGGIPEILEDDINGSLVPARDPKAMADAITRLLNDPAGAARLASAARLRVEDFTPEAYRHSMIKVYLEVLNRTGTNRSVNADYPFG